MSIEKLRELAAGVLAYDISGMPDEAPGKTEEYRQKVLAVMSRADLIRCILLQPTVRLSPTDNNTGVEAQYMMEPLINLYFTRDHKRWQMHLDTHFNIIDSNLCTMVRSRLEALPGDPEYNTCDIWAREPGSKEYHLWRQGQPFADYIRSRGFQIIPIDYDDEMHYGVKSVSAHVGRTTWYLP